MPRIFRNGRDYSGSSAQIDDNTAANNKVYSSAKVAELNSGKQDNLSKTRITANADTLYSTNAVYRCVDSSISNCPATDGNLMVFANGEGCSAFQFFIPASGDVLYMRITWGAGTISWTSWKKVTFTT